MLQNWHKNWKIPDEKNSGVKRALFILIILTGLLIPEANSGFYYGINKNRGMAKSDKMNREVNAILEAYGDMISKVESKDNDVVFHINNKEIFYCDGKMLARNNLHDKKSFKSIIYPYPGLHNNVIDIVEWDKTPRSSDFTEALFGSSSEISKHCKWIKFIRHSIYINNAIIDQLSKVEAEILKSAETKPEIMKFIDDCKAIFAFMPRNIKGTNSKSFHAFGLALDLIPESYNNKDVVWSWTKVFNKNWHLVPMEKRWSPPKEVIQAFENHGFIWGGNWLRYDNIHFEYRPEILEFNKNKDLELIPDFLKFRGVNIKAE
ncbi:M15 family metallopeptidase [Bacteroidota bacterium]